MRLFREPVKDAGVAELCSALELLLGRLRAFRVERQKTTCAKISCLATPDLLDGQRGGFPARPTADVVNSPQFRQLKVSAHIAVR